jgi:hypothetical protein
VDVWINDSSTVKKNELYLQQKTGQNKRHKPLFEEFQTGVESQKRLATIDDKDNSPKRRLDRKDKRRTSLNKLE